MNRIISMAIALIMAINMNAQEGYEDTKHEVSITFGIEPTSQRIENFKNLGGAIGYTDNDKYMEPISAEYFYHINKMISLGAVFTEILNRTYMIAIPILLIVLLHFVKE